MWNNCHFEFIPIKIYAHPTLKVNVNTNNPILSNIKASCIHNSESPVSGSVSVCDMLILPDSASFVFLFLSNFWNSWEIYLSLKVKL